jgi:hypothetical protein
MNEVVQVEVVDLAGVELGESGAHVLECVRSCVW